MKIKSLFFFITIGFLLISCGGNKNTGENNEDIKDFSIESSATNSAQEFAEFILLSSPATLSVEGNYLRLTVVPSSISQTDLIVDYDNADAVLLDKDGATIGEPLHSYNGFIDLNKALNAGDGSLCEGISFHDYVESNEVADNIASNAKTFVLIMPLIEAEELEARYAAKKAQSDSSDNTGNNDYAPIEFTGVVDEFWGDERPQSAKVQRCMGYVLQELDIALTYNDAEENGLSEDKINQLFENYIILDKAESKIFYDELSSEEISEYHKFRDKIIESDRISPIWKKMREGYHAYCEKKRNGY